MILKDQQLIRDFVKARRILFANETLLQQVKRTLSSSYSFEDMAFIVSQADKELTPEEKALLLINANVAATGTHSEKATFPQVISVESLNEVSSQSVIISSNAFADLWCNLTSMAQSLKSINACTALHIDEIVKLNNQATIDSSKQDPKEASVMTLTSLPQLLKVSSDYNSDFIIGIDSLNQYSKDHIGKETFKTLDYIKELIKNGMNDFSSKSIRATEATLQSHEKQFKLAITIATERTQLSSDGLVTTLVIDNTTQEKALFENGEVVVGNNQLAPSVVIDGNTLSMVADRLKCNLELINLSSKACDLILDLELRNAVISFSQTSQKLLESSSLNPRTKEVVKSYCGLFIDAVNKANDEVSFMLNKAQFVVCFNELLVDIIKHVCPSTQLEVV